LRNACGWVPKWKRVENGWGLLLGLGKGRSKMVPGLLGRIYACDLYSIKILHILLYFKTQSIFRCEDLFHDVGLHYHFVEPLLMHLSRWQLWLK